MALNEAKEKVCLLENAIRKLDAMKRHLSHSASDIKVEIHSCVSHNLECLRGREVSLLGKVDELVTQKEEALQRQQARLNQALGVLQTRMAMMTSSESVLDQQLTEILTKFNEIDLSPGETPHIAFRADHMSLRECILNYGRLDSNALPLPPTFELPGKPSASLPRHLEEYEDEDHHIFYKTVEEIKESNSSSKSITVTIPKLSTRMEDWLLKREVCDAPPSHVSSACDTKTTSVAAQTRHPAPGDTCSLNNWLSQIKSHSDLEEEHNFEIVDNSQAKKAKFDKSMDMQEDLKKWLHNSPSYLDNLLTAQKQTLNLFKHIPTDSKFWLRSSCDQGPVTTDGVKDKDMFRHISKEPSTWLRSRAHSKQTAAASPMMEVDKSAGLKDVDMNHWLAKSSQTAQEVVENVSNNTNSNNSSNSSCCRQGGWLQQTSSPNRTTSFELEDICKANELCSNVTDCVCKPNCVTLHQQETSGVKNPLDPTKVFRPLQLSLSDWLPRRGRRVDEDASDCCEKMEVSSQNENEENCCGDASSCVENPIGKRLFAHIADASNDQWLLKPASPTTSVGTMSSIPTFKHCKEETNLWLQQVKETSSVDTTLESNAKDILSFNPSNKSLSEWLSSPVKLTLTESTKEQEVGEDNFMKEDSEGWSLCSSPATFNSDQFSKDVKVATSYMQDWVL